MKILYEDNHLIAINKLPGQLVQGDITGDETLPDLLKAWLKEKYQKPGSIFLGVIHRLDRPVSGVALFAKTSKALSRMNALFHKREMKKTYLAVTTGSPLSHEKLIHYLIKDKDQNKVKAFLKEKEGAQRSELDYELIQKEGTYNLLKVSPLTGRPHQIRVQLSTRGFIIAGDLKYGSAKPNADKSICLHASELEFIHPVKNEKIIIKAPITNKAIWEKYMNI